MSLLSSMSSRTLLSLGFTGACAYSAAVWFLRARASAAAAAPARGGGRPALGSAETLEVLGELAASAERIVGEVEAGVRLARSAGGGSPAGAAEARALGGAPARRLVQEELVAAAARVYASHATTEAGVEHAVAHHMARSAARGGGAGAGAGSAFAASIGRYKRAVGKYVLCHSAVLGVMRATFECQAALTQQLAEEALNSGRCSNAMELQRYLSSPSVQRHVQSTIEALTLDATGLSMSALDEATQGAEFSGDAVFQNALVRVAGEGQQLLAGAQQALMAMVGGA